MCNPHRPLPSPSRTSMNAPSLSYNKDFGRKGDPRVNRALAIKLENPDVTLYEALQLGGFSYRCDSNSAVDSDGVSLSQRKNNLTRRLRQTRRVQKKTSLWKAARQSTAGTAVQDTTTRSFSPKTSPPQRLGFPIKPNPLDSQASSRRPTASPSGEDSTTPQRNQGFDEYLRLDDEDDWLWLREDPSSVEPLPFEAIDNPEPSSSTLKRDVSSRMISLLSLGDEEEERSNNDKDNNNKTTSAPPFSVFAGTTQIAAYSPGPVKTNPMVQNTCGRVGPKDWRPGCSSLDSSSNSFPEGRFSPCIGFEQGPQATTRPSSSTRTPMESSSGPDSDDMTKNNPRMQMALRLFQTEARALYQRCMLMAGYSTDDIKESSPCSMAFAGAAWHAEGCRLLGKYSDPERGDSLGTSDTFR